jgi:predicted nucleic acid-binding protein
MTAIDTNVLVGLLVIGSPSRAAAIEGLENFQDDFCTTSTNVGEILRLITHRKVFSNPISLDKAVASLSDLLNHYQIRVLDESPEWWRELTGLVNDIPDLRGSEIFDAKIAICLRQHNVKKIFTWDSDFKKYPFLQPLKTHSSKK